MSDEAALLAAIRDHPDEDTPRLVYADWLIEHDHVERAEFIRAQIEVARLPDDDPRRTELEVTERRLLAKNAVEWTDPFPAFQNWEYAGDGPYRVVFRRGFLESVEGFSVPGSTPGDNFAERQAVHPIRAIAFDGNVLNLSAGLGWPGWERIESLSLGLWINGRETAAHSREQLKQVDTFLRHAPLARLRKLHVVLPGITERDIVHWFRMPLVRRLESLALTTWNRTSPPISETVLELANGNFPNLRELHLVTDASPDCSRALDRFIASDTWKRLTQFSVAGPFPWFKAFSAARLERLTVHLPADIGAVQTFTNALVSMSGPPTLEELNLHGRAPSAHAGENLSRILDAHGLTNLRRLGFEHGQFTADFKRLVNAPVLGRLHRLTCAAERDVLETLFAAPLDQLTHLSVSGNVTPEAVMALAQNESCRRLRQLALGSLFVPTALNALSSGAAFPELHTVSFSSSHPSPVPTTIEEFLNSPKLPRLCVVPFSVGSDYLKRLLPVFQNCGRLAWAGGEMADGGDGVRVAVVPENVYLSNHLDDLLERFW